MTCIAKTPDGALEYFIAIEDAMQDALWGEITRMAKKNCFSRLPQLYQAGTARCRRTTWTPRSLR